MTDYFAGDPRTNRERTLAGDPYIADDPEIERRAKRAVRLQDEYHRAVVADDDGARAILADLLGTLGEGAFVKPPLFVDYGEHPHIGARTFVNYNLTALDVAEIRIGEDCQLGPGVQLLTPTHPVEPQPRRDKIEGAKPITIGDNVWLGGGVIVGPGVTIGENTVVGRARSSSRTFRPTSSPWATPPAWCGTSTRAERSVGRRAEASAVAGRRPLTGGTSAGTTRPRSTGCSGAAWW